MATPSIRSSSVARVGAAPSTGARAGWFKSSQRALGRDWPIAWMFMLPTVALLFGLIGYPFLRGAWLSVVNTVGTREGPFVGLLNFQNLFADDFFKRSIAVSLTFTFWSEIFKFSIGLMAALLLHNVPKWGAVLGGIILLPYIIPEVVRALAWRVLLDPLFGALNYILINVFHVMSKGPSWLGDPATALPSVTGVNVWAGIPFFVILFLAGLKAVDQEVYDAASVDGANAWRRFLHVTLPGLRYVIIVAVLLSTIFTLNGFTLTYLLTGGGPGGATRVYPILASEYANALRYSAGSAVAMTVAPFLFLLILILGRFMMRREDVAHTTSDEGMLWRLFTWPLRMIGSVIMSVFWLINGMGESIAAVISGAFRRTNLPPASRKTKARAKNVMLYGFVGLILLFEIVPFYFIFVTSFKSTLQIQQIRDMFWPNPWTLEHFTALFTTIPFATWYFNTIVVALSATVVSMFAASLGAYALVRLKWKGVGPLSTAVLVAYLLPPVLMFIPLFWILAQLRLVNTLGALIIVYPSVVLPFATWLMMGYYRSIPEELEDAAQIDGCNRFQTYYRVVLPLVRPALLAVAMFSITQAWNEYLYAKTFLRSTEVFTLPVGLGQMIVGDVQPWGELMAASLLTALPVVIIYMLGQRFMVAGLTAGSVKG